MTVASDTETENGVKYLFDIDQKTDVTQVGYSVCKENWGILNRTLPENELIVVFKGTLFCDIGGESHVIREGGACIIPADTCSSHYTENGRCRFYYAHFTGTLQPIVDEELPEAAAALDRARGAEKADTLFLSTGWENKQAKLILCSEMKCANYMEEIESIFAKILIERDHKNTGRLLLINFYLYHILILLCRQYTGLFFKTTATGTSQKKIVQEALRYIDEHYSDQIGLIELSRLVGVSQQYLSRLFRSETGVSPVKYINALRITRAKELISGTHLNISEVAFQVGFDSLYYFSRVFKQYEGISPSTYKLWLNSKSNQ